MSLHGSLDAVILAGGQSSRLAGIVPPYHKPFLVVDGTSLLLRAVNQAHAVRAKRIVVVTCPEIALPTSQLLERTDIEDFRLHVVLRTGGPGYALHEGLLLCREDRVLVLMADNVNDTIDVAEMVSGHRFAVGVRDVPSAEASRFTRYVNHRWVENGAVEVFSPSTTVWCGPLVISRQQGLQVLAMSDGAIGPHLDYLAPDGCLARVPVDSYDIGTPEALTSFKEGQRR